MKKIIILIFFSLILFSCSNEEEIQEEIVKQDYILQTKPVKEFSLDSYIWKTWKLSSTQDIKISSQAPWRVSRIYVKEWDYVRKWQSLASLQDNLANYWISLDIAENNLEKAKLNYKTTKSKLDKAVSDIEINLENLQIDEFSSQSALELEKLENSIKKLNLDYEKLKVSNQSTISWFETSLWKDFVSLKTLSSDIIYFADSLLWVSQERKKDNDRFEDYLWVKDSIQKKETKILLEKFIKNYDEKLISYNNELSFEENINIISDSYLKIDELLDNLNLVLENSISSVWSFSKETISAHKSTINSFELSASWNKSAFIALKNQLESFLDTYKSTEESLLKQIELLESDRKIYVKSLDVQMNLSESSLDDAKLNRDLSLESLNIAIRDAEIAYSRALKDYNKLTITSPISWLVWEVLIDQWQEINIWTPAFSVSNNLSSEVVISFSKEELDLVSVWKKAYIDYEDKIYTGSIYSISSVADSNLKYISRISFDNWVNLIWDIAPVKIPFISEKILLPVNILKISGDWKAILYVFKDNKIEQVAIEVWEIYWDKIEILSELDLDYQIIVSNVSNYDENKFNLKQNEK